MRKIKAPFRSRDDLMRLSIERHTIRSRGRPQKKLKYSTGEIINVKKIKPMGTKKQKPVYVVTAYDDVTATAVYSCLKTLCEQWDCIEHYSTIWKWLRKHEQPYEDSKISIKKCVLIRSAYNRKPHGTAGR